MWKIIIGVIFIVGGLGGTMVLRFTNSSEALVVVGIGILIWGLVEVSRGSRKSSSTRPKTVADRAAMATRAAKALGLDPRKSRAVAYLYEHRSMSAAEYENLCPGIDQATLDGDLKELVEMGVMTPDGERFVIT